MPVKIKEITYSRGATVNRGNVNNERIEVSVTAQVEGDEPPDEVFSRLRTWAKAKIAADMKEPML